MAAAPLSQTASFHVAAPASRAITLFTAEGERLWAPSWEPEMLSGDTARGSVFRTTAHGRTTTWIVVDYRPAEGRASYARLAEGSNIGIVDVRCTDDGHGETNVGVTYTLTGLDADGDAFVRHQLDPTHYAAFIGEWRAAIAGALARGALSAPAAPR